MNNFPGGSRLRRNRLICESSTVDSLCERFESSHSYLNHERIIIKRDLYLDPRFRLQKEEESKVSRSKTVAINRRYVIVWAFFNKKEMPRRIVRFLSAINSVAMVRVVKTIFPILSLYLGKNHSWHSRCIFHYDSIVERIFQVNLACNENRIKKEFSLGKKSWNKAVSNLLWIRYPIHYYISKFLINLN